jgi:hypothetical protein
MVRAAWRAGRRPWRRELPAAGLSEQEIAAQLGCSPGTVKSRASRAIAGLRRTDGPLADLLRDHMLSG